MAHSTLPVLSHPDFNLADHQRLSRERDFAAYRAVGAIDAAICYCRLGDAAEALNILTRARAYYELADSNLQNLKNQKENSTNGNRRGGG